jgi:hypothetical protein
VRDLFGLELSPVAEALELELRSFRFCNKASESRSMDFEADMLLRELSLSCVQIPSKDVAVVVDACLISEHIPSNDKTSVSDLFFNSERMPSNDAITASNFVAIVAIVSSSLAFLCC